MINKKQFKVETGGFTTTFNDIFRYTIKGKKLSPESWGLYVFMLSLPDNWDYTILGLTKVVNSGRDKIQRMLKELEIAGFLTRKQENKGRFGKIQYTIHTKSKYSKTENTDTVKSHTKKQLQQKTNKQIDKLKIKEVSFPKDIHYLTKELINKKFINSLDYSLNDFNDLFKTLDTEYDYRSVIKATRYVITRMNINKDSIDNKFNYFKSSIYSNLEYLKRKSKNHLGEDSSWIDNLIKDFDIIKKTI